jgi:hypothetical protein
MLRKEILTVREKIYTISLAVGKLEEKLQRKKIQVLIKEN